MDVKEQGEGLVDVMTHLVDLVQWECFPDQIIDTNQIQIHPSLRWPTKMSLNQFNTITKSNGFPDYLKSSLASDTVLNVYSNGEIIFKINDVYAKTSVIWNYQAPEGTGDTHYSIMKGSTSHLEIRQGKEENYKPTLYILPQSNIDSNYINEINAQLKSLDQQWPPKSTKSIANFLKPCTFPQIFCDDWPDWWQSPVTIVWDTTVCPGDCHLNGHKLKSRILLIA